METGWEELETHITRRKNIVEQYIVTRPITYL